MNNPTSLLEIHSQLSIFAGSLAQQQGPSLQPAEINRLALVLYAAQFGLDPDHPDLIAIFN